MNGLIQGWLPAQVEWNMTPQEFSLAGLWQNLPIYAFFAFAFSFLGVCLAIGIFKCAHGPCSLGSIVDAAQSERLHSER